MKEQKCCDCGKELLGHADFDRMCSECDEKHMQSIREAEETFEDQLFREVP